MNKGEIGSEADLAWYVLYTAPRSERGVMDRIKRDLGATTVVPMRTEETRRGGVRRRLAKTVFPRYVFMGVDGDPDRCWFKLPSIMGVQRVLATEGRPLRIHPTIVGDLISASARGLFDILLDEPGLNDPDGFATGDLVKVLSGPFWTFTGSFVSVDAEGRAEILLTLFGREFPALIDVDQLAHVR